jgi:hypothetical protein
MIGNDIVQIPSRMAYGDIQIVTFRARNDPNHQYYTGFEIIAYTQYYGVAAVPVKAALIIPHEIAIQLPGWNPYNRHDAFSVEMNAPAVFRIVLFKFPNTMFLSNTIFSPESISGNIVMNTFMTMTTGVIRNYCNVHVLSNDDDENDNNNNNSLEQIDSSNSTTDSSAY